MGTPSYKIGQSIAKTVVNAVKFRDYPFWEYAYYLYVGGSGELR